MNYNIERSHVKGTGVKDSETAEEGYYVGGGTQ